MDMKPRKKTALFTTNTSSLFNKENNHYLSLTPKHKGRIKTE